MKLLAHKWSRARLVDEGVPVVNVCVSVSVHAERAASGRICGRPWVRVCVRVRVRVPRAVRPWVRV